MPWLRVMLGEQMPPSPEPNPPISRYGVKFLIFAPVIMILLPWAYQQVKIPEFPRGGNACWCLSICRDIKAHTVVLHAMAYACLVAWLSFPTFVGGHVTVDFEWIPGCIWINPEFTIPHWVLALSNIFARATWGPVCGTFFHWKIWFWD